MSSMNVSSRRCSVERVEGRETRPCFVVADVRLERSNHSLSVKSGLPLLGAGLGGGWVFRDIGRRLAADVTVPWTPFTWCSGYILGRVYIGPDTGQPCAARAYCTPATVTYPGRHGSRNSGEKKFECPTTKPAVSRLPNKKGSQREVIKIGKGREDENGNDERVLEWKWQARSAASINLLVTAEFAQGIHLHSSRPSSPLLPFSSSLGLAQERPVSPGPCQSFVGSLAAAGTRGTGT